jgi:hypothetical protein
MQKLNNIGYRLSDFWVVSGKAMTIISLIIIPLLVILSHYFIYDQAQNCVYFEKDPKTGQLTLIKKCSSQFFAALAIITYLQIVVFIFILVVYPPYPAPASLERYFRDRGYRKAVDEYEFIKKLLYVIIPLVLLFGIWSTESIAEPILNSTIQFLPSEVKQEIQANPQSVSASLNKDELYVDYPALLLMLVFFAVIFKLLCIRMRKDFRLYYARGCFVICRDENNEARKMSYFTMGLNSYNHYLRRLISLEIGDLKTKIYSKIASSPIDEKNQIMQDIMEDFLPDKYVESNTLEPVRQLAKFSQKPVSAFLTRQPFLNKLKEWAAIASVIATMLVSLIGLLPS